MVTKVTNFVYKGCWTRNTFSKFYYTSPFHCYYNKNQEKVHHTYSQIIKDQYSRFSFFVELLTTCCFLLCSWEMGSTMASVRIRFSIMHLVRISFSKSYSIGTGRLLFKLKFVFMFSSSSNTKVKICEGFGVKTDGLIKFLLQKVLQNIFFFYINFVDAKLFLITTGSTRCKKLMDRFRFQFARGDRFTIIFSIM